MKIIKIVLLLICNLLFAICDIQAQNIDSLKLALRNAKHDTTIIKLCLELGEAIYLNDAKQALELWTKAQLLAEKGVTTTNKAFYLKHLASALNNIGFIYQSQGDISKALEYYNRSLKIQEEIKDKEGISDSLNNIGFIYYNQGDIPKALEYFHRSLKIQEEIEDKYGIANSLNNIGSIYRKQGDIPKALEYQHKSLKIREEINDKKGIAESLNNIGIIYNNQGNRSKALEYFHRSLKIREEINEKRGISESLNNIGAIYKDQGDIPKALEYYLRSLKIREEIKNKSGIASSLSSIAGFMLESGRVAEALELATRSMKIANELGYPDDIKYAAGTLKSIYKKQNKFALAFEMYELEILMRDSINNEATKKASIQKQFQYEYEKKAAADSVANAKQHEIKNIEIKKQQAEIKAKRNQQYALYGGLTMVIVFAGFMYNRFRVTNKQKQIIEIKEKETQQQKHIIEEKHKEITDSINYAERIQRSFLATKELLDENLNDYFVLFQPKDVVSGDFYWATKLSNGNFALATADSTGHGVPGAIMSLLNITSLESAIKEGYTQPAEILNATRKTIIERLKKDGSVEGGKDGMDCSLTIYDFNTKKLFVTAANNPVWIVRGIEVIEIKPDKMPVGKHDKQDILFTQQEIDLQSGDVVYTLTDGFPDQFGGENGKKFMSKKLRELLLANANLPMQEQKELLQTTFKNWVGELEQVDDVCVIGVRV